MSAPLCDRGSDQPAPQRYGVPAWRLVIGVLVLPLMGLGAALAYLTMARDSLPDPIATHFAMGGAANGAMSLDSFVTMTVPMALLLWGLGVLPVLAARNRRVRFRGERVAMAWCTAATWFLSTIIVLTIGANVDQPTWATARLSGAAIIPPLVLASLGALVAWVVAGPPPELPAVAAGGCGADGADGAVAPEPLELAAGESPVWHGHLTSTWMAVLALVILVVGAVLFRVNPGLAVVMVISAAVVAPLSSVATVVDPSGLDVRFGPFGWPRKHIALGRIAAVKVARELEPLRWGGWGYRMVPGRSAVVLRRGPALVLDLVDGRSFAVTIDEPEAGAALLDAYRRRASDG